MRDIKRIPKVLQKLENIWKQYPDLRLGQLIGNMIEGVSLYYIEDWDLINALKEYYERAKESEDV